MDYVQLIHVNPYHVDSPFLLHTQPPCWCSRWGTRSEACRANDPNFGRKTAVSTLRRRGKSLGKISIYHDLPLKHGDFLWYINKHRENHHIWFKQGGRKTGISGRLNKETDDITRIFWDTLCLKHIQVCKEICGSMVTWAERHQVRKVQSLHCIVFRVLNRTFNILSVSKVQFVFPVSAWSDLTNTTNKKVMYDDVSQQKTSVQPTVNRQPLRLQYFWDHIH